MFIVVYDRGNGIYDTVTTTEDRLSAIGLAVQAVRAGGTGSYLVLEQVAAIKPKVVKPEAEVVEYPKELK